MSWWVRCEYVTIVVLQNIQEWGRRGDFVWVVKDNYEVKWVRREQQYKTGDPFHVTGQTLMSVHCFFCASSKCYDLIAESIH